MCADLCTFLNRHTNKKVSIRLLGTIADANVVMAKVLDAGTDYLLAEIVEFGSKKFCIPYSAIVCIGLQKPPDDEAVGIGVAV